MRHLIFITVFLLLSLTAISAFAQAPTDLAVALRETRIQENLELYPAILATAAPKQYFPLLDVTEDEYGIVWAHVQLEDDKTGYLTDMIAIRMAPKDLESVLSQVSNDELAGWNQETIEAIRGAKLEIGMTRTQVLLARGVPLSSRFIGNIEELSYEREKILLQEGSVSAFTDVKRLLLDKAVQIRFDALDPAFTAAGGRWEETVIGEETYRIDVSGSGVGRFRVQVPTDGTYRIFATWMATEQSSSKVIYKVNRRREEIARFTTNQRLHNLKEVELGTVTLAADGTVVIEISAEDGAPFSVGLLSIVYVNEPLAVL